jgi:hypothetical protein
MNDNGKPGETPGRKAKGAKANGQASPAAKHFTFQGKEERNDGK